MDYEQKYKEALERGRALKERIQGMDIISEIFPELAESDDEKIRKELISAIEWSINNGIFPSHIIPSVRTKDWISWLEKQKPAVWSKEDEGMIKETIYFINQFQKSNQCLNEQDMQNSVSCEIWLKSLKHKLH